MVETPLWLLIILLQLSILLLLAAGIVWLMYRRARQRAAQFKAQLETQAQRATTHKLRIAELEVQLESLNSFEEMYFELVAEHEKTQALQAEFQQQANAMLCESDRASLQQSLDELTNQKQLLENKLKSVQDALEEILVKQANVQDAALSGADVLNTSARVEVEIAAIRDVIVQQKTLITHLNGQLSHLQLEVDDKHKLETLLQRLEAQNATLNKTLSDMQRENAHLREQVRTLQIQERAQLNDNTEEVQALRETLAAREQAYVELEKKFIAIETEYQRIYAKSQKLQA